jgi:hypothetical protein
MSRSDTKFKPGHAKPAKAFSFKPGNQLGVGNLKPGCNRTHGLSGTREYAVYMSARSRCNNPNNPDYSKWGGRGVNFLFTSQEQFYAELGPKPSPIHSVDRWPNPQGNYEPGNIRWATPKEQRANQHRLTADELNYELLVAYAETSVGPR